MTHNITNRTNIIDIAKNRELVKLVFTLMSGIINDITVVKEKKIDKCSFTYMPTISKITDNFIIEIDFTTKKVTALENGKPSAQKFLFVSANNNPVELEKEDVVDIDMSINGTNVSTLKWKNEMMNQVFELHKADNNEWEYYEEAIKMKESFPNEEKLFKQTASDNNSITLVEINPDPKNTMFYATKLKIDIAAKIVFKAVYEADTKKWTPLEKDENGTK
jgi:hypothetical protein